MTIIDRSKGLGASDSAAACGVSKWKTPYQLWLEKTGQSDVDLSELLHIQIGNALEPMILDRFCKNNKLTIKDQQKRFIDVERPWRWATVDAISSDGGLVEAKSVGFANPADWGEDQSDMVPMQYYVQSQWGLSCTDLKFAWIPVVVLNREERLYRVERDDDFISDMIERATGFWNCVLTNTAPDMVTLEDCQLAWPTDNGGLVVADEAIEKIVAELKGIKADIKQLDAREESCKVTIAAFMQECSELISLHGAELLTFKEQSRTSLDSKALRQDHPGLAEQYSKTTSFRTMRLK